MKPTMTLKQQRRKAIKIQNANKGKKISMMEAMKLAAKED